MSNVSIPKPPKSIFVLNFFIFNATFAFTFLYAWYTKIIPIEELSRFFSSLPSLVTLILNLSTPCVVYKIFTNMLENYKDGSAGIDEANKALSICFKISLAVPVILTPIAIFSALYWLGIHSLAKIIACVLGAIGWLNFIFAFRKRSYYHVVYYPHNADKLFSFFGDYIVVHGSICWNALQRFGYCANVAKDYSDCIVDACCCTFYKLHNV